MSSAVAHSPIIDQLNTTHGRRVCTLEDRTYFFNPIEGWVNPVLPLVILVSTPLSIQPRWNTPTRDIAIFNSNQHV